MSEYWSDLWRTAENVKHPILKVLSMILRSNKKLVDAYLLELINQVSSATIQIKQTHLITLLKFVGEKPLKKAMPVLTGYKRHLLSIDARRDGKKEPLSHSTIRKNLGDIRDFLDWLIDEKDFNWVCL